MIQNPSRQRHEKNTFTLSVLFFLFCYVCLCRNKRACGRCAAIDAIKFIVCAQRTARKHARGARGQERTRLNPSASVSPALVIPVGSRHIREINKGKASSLPRTIGKLNNSLKTSLFGVQIKSTDSGRRTRRGTARLYHRGISTFTRIDSQTWGARAQCIHRNTIFRDT